MNKEERKIYNREYEKRPEVKAKRKKRSKEYSLTEERQLYIRERSRTKSYREKIKAYKRKLYQTNKKYRLDTSTGNIFWNVLKHNKRLKRFSILVSYLPDELRAHLESKFDTKMNWDNYGSYWSIDHITPKCNFKYETINDEAFIECWSLINLQPLEVSANRKKYNKLNATLCQQ